MTRTIKTPPLHPGEILEKEFLTPLKLTQYRIAKDIAVPPRRINEIVQGKRAVTADTALRLGKYFSVSPQFWTNLQSRYDLATAEDQLASVLAHQVKVCVACAV
ncbi:HigA family addiction module antidote protein [Candidatus Uhrbacteria bacterium]|nr:HigA family addiction module antidote protein [Candidatus Uhrbacteria bacterium]